MLEDFFHKSWLTWIQKCTGKSIDTEITGIQESLRLLPLHPWKVISPVLHVTSFRTRKNDHIPSCEFKDSRKIVLAKIKTLLLTTKSRNLILAKISTYTVKKLIIFFQVNCYIFLKVRWISRQMTMILMYVSSQTVPESAIEDDDTKNKKSPCVWNLENKIPQNIFSAKLCM